MVRGIQKPKPDNGLPPEITRATLAIDSIVANPRNPRNHPVEQLEKLAASIRRFGQPRDVLVRKANMMIVAGHGVTEACRIAGKTEINITVWDVDQATADAFMVGDNRLGQLGKDDKAQVELLLRELGFADPDSIGYSAAELDDLLAEAAEDIDVVEIPVGTVEDRFWIQVRGPLVHQAASLQRLTEALRDLDDVHVELGTITDG